MSQQQVQRLQTLLETVQRNRQRPGEPIGAGSNLAAANVVQNKPAANQAAAAEPPSRPRIQREEPKAAPAPQAAAAPARPAAAAKPAAAPALPPSQPKVPLRPEPQAAPPHAFAAAQEPIVPRTIDPDVPRPATRPIAQLVSKHAPAVDATFGAMLKRSLSLRPQ